MTTPYQKGYTFEKMVATDLELRGYKCTTARGSHSPVDVVARKIKEDEDGTVTEDCVCLEVQCKRDGKMSPDDWNKLMDWCDKSGGIPVLARREEYANGKHFVRYFKLIARKGDRKYFGAISEEILAK